MLVGALGGAVNQHSSRVNPVLVVLSRVVPTVDHLQAALPDGAAWGSGLGGGLAGVWSSDAWAPAAHTLLHFVDAIVDQPRQWICRHGPRSQWRR